MKIRTTLITTAALAGLGGMILNAAQADINPIAPNTATITAVTGGYQYTYPIQVATNETVVTGSFFTFFDVQGLVADSEFGPNANWSYTSSLTGPEALGTYTKSDPLVDSASIPNVTFTYNGPTALIGQQSLGNFGFVSTDPQGTTSEGFTAVAEVTGTTTNNSNATNYFGPTATTAVPEPSEMAAFAIGSLGLLGLGLRARKVRLGA